jgi:hypothetical protein
MNISKRYSMFRINSKPPKLEAKIAFNVKDMSQQLIFRIMNITHRRGISCSSPSIANDNDVIFLVGTFINGIFGQKKSVRILEKCLDDLKEFINDFDTQLDFSRADLSMFENVNLPKIDVMEIIAVRDQYFNGSWIVFRDEIIESGVADGVDIIDSCIEFEAINNKDLGLVGHKLAETLTILSGHLSKESHELN